MQTYDIAILISYLVVVGILAIFGAHRYQMVYLYYKNKRNPKRPRKTFNGLPKVTVQLPLYNEMYVVERLLDAVTALEYPRDHLEIQVLDDSTDETQEITRAKVSELRKQGLNVNYIHRDNRHGFKAGALQEGLEVAEGEYIVIFDADFMPRPDMLQKTIHFFTDPKVALVQTRWGHLNNDYSILTEVQSILLDGHLVIEQTARNRSGRFFNFNGTGGIWRKQAIIDAGGWEHDTLTEDLDLSFRAQLKGWRFVFLPDVLTPAELPVDMNGYKVQQHRWAKGAIQTMKKILPTVWRSRFPLKVKIEATLQLTMNFAYVLMVLLALLLYPVLSVRFHKGFLGMLLIDIPLFVAAFTSIVSFYLCSQREIYENWVSRIKYMPMLLSVGIGMSLSNARGVLEGLIGHQSEFVRTPKYAIQGTTGSWKAKKYKSFKSLLPLLELAMAVYFVFVVISAFQMGRYVAVPFLILFLLGFFYVGYRSLFQGERKTREKAAMAAVK
jgi:cellulose synthase/poly-beta-1,6-N-acetylglucosamine synthase-like glycosyltransferase